MNATNLISALGGYYKGQKEASLEREDIRRWEAGRQQQEQQIAIQREQLGLERERLLQQADQDEWTKQHTVWKDNYDMRLSTAQQLASLMGISAHNTEAITALMGGIENRRLVEASTKAQEARLAYEWEVDKRDKGHGDMIALAATAALDQKANLELEVERAKEMGNYNHLEWLAERAQLTAFWTPVITEAAQAAANDPTHLSDNKLTAAIHIGSIFANAGRTDDGVATIQNFANTLNIGDPNWEGVRRLVGVASASIGAMPRRMPMPLPAMSPAPGPVNLPPEAVPVPSGGNVGSPALPSPGFPDPIEHLRPFIRGIWKSKSVRQEDKDAFIASGLVKDGRTLDPVDAARWWGQRLGANHPALTDLNKAMRLLQPREVPTGLMGRVGPSPSYGEQVMGPPPQPLDTLTPMQLRIQLWNALNPVPTYKRPPFTLPSQYRQNAPEWGQIQSLQEQNKQLAETIEKLGGQAGVLPTAVPFTYRPRKRGW